MYADQICEKSILHRLDPRTKLILTALLTTLVFIIDVLPLAAVQMLLFICLCLMSKIPLKRLFPQIKFLLSILILVLLLQAIFGYDSGYYYLKPLIPDFIPVIGGLGSIKKDGFLSGLTVCCRIISVSVLMPVLILTTGTRNLTYGITKLGINYRYAYMISSALNLIPSFEYDFHLLLDARSLRGKKSPKKMNIFLRLREYSMLIVPLIIKAMRQAEMMGLAMDSRAFGVYKKRVWLNEKRFTTADYGAFTIGIAYSLITVAANIIFKR